jgi:Flp pilus assembly protein TadD
MRGSLRGLQHDYAGAIDDFTAAIALDAKDAGLYCGRAMAHLQLEQYASASADFDIAESLQSGSCSAKMSAAAHAHIH